MRRLLQITLGTIPGGTERYALTIGAAAAAEGWEVHAALPRTEANAGLLGAYREAGAKTYGLEPLALRPPPVEVAVAAARTMRLLRRVRPSVAHVNLPLPTFGRGALVACALCRVPTVVVFHLAPDGFGVGRSGRLYAALRAHGQRWVAVSEHVRQTIAGSFGVRPQEVTVIRNGVPPVSAGPPSDEERVEVRRELALPDSAVIALSAGRLSKQKAHADLIPCAEEAAKRFPQLHFVVAGEGEERAALEELIREHRLEATVHLVGHRSDLDRLFRAADLCLFPSRAEGFPFALLQAAAHGLAIICAGFGGAREIVAHEESALLHPPGDTAALWRCVEFALEHPAEMRTMGQRAKSVVDAFSQEEMVRATLELLAGQAERVPTAG